MNKKTLFIGITVVLLLVFVGATMVFNNQKLVSKNEILMDNSSKLMRIGAPMKGAEDAKVTIVEFLDPACETCAAFYPLVNKLLKKHSGKIKVIVRYAPLHKGSDQVVRLLEATHLQGEFWSALELLFANQRIWTINHVSQPQIAKEILGKLSLNQSKFAKDLYSQTVSDAINKDLSDGQSLRVRATPEFFVNGRQMQTFGYKQFVQLVEDEVSKHYK